MKFITGLLLLFLNIYTIGFSFAQDIPFVYNVENTGKDCPAPLLPSFIELQSIEHLPDPLMPADRSGRITKVC